jgi:ribose-phosphate pyrophosphokinase
MKIIDSDNYPASGIETLFFPGGEPHARIPKDMGDSLLYLKARTWNDVGLALVVLDALFHQSPSDVKIWVFCPYFPGARQDRSDGQTPVTSALMLDMFKHLTDMNRLYVFDAHSKATIDHVHKNFMPDELPFTLDPGTVIIAPDHGAIERANLFERSKGWGNPVVCCDKKRNFATGKFEGFTMPPLPPASGYLIVDDICDGGGTFNLLATEFEKDPMAQHAELALWVSHGIFSNPKGVGNISQTIKKIHTTDSFYRPLSVTGESDPRLTIHSLSPIIQKIKKEAESEV